MSVEDLAVHIFGYCVGFVNALVWTEFFDRHLVSNGPLPWQYDAISGSRRRILRVIQLALIPVFLAGPLFSPFAALPLAQQVRLNPKPE